MKLRLCRDKDCLHYGIALPITEFGRNAYYDTRGARDGLSIYCRRCTQRRTREYRLNMEVIIQRTKVRLPATAFD